MRMKNYGRILTMVVTFSSIGGTAASYADTLASSPTTNSQQATITYSARSAWAAEALDAHSTRWISTQHATNASTGKVTVVTNAFTEIASQLNILTDQGTLQPAN